MRTFYSIIILLLISNSTVYCQSERIKCEGETIRFTNGNINHFRKIVCCPTIRVTKNKFPKKIIDSCTSYLVNRIGREFYTKLGKPTYDIVRLDLEDSLSIVNPCESRENCEDTLAKYAIGYNFHLFNEMRYYFTIIFNNEGEVISEEQLPEIKSNKNCFDLINPCAAIKIANSDSVYSQKSNNITLNYSSQHNSLIWIVELNDIRTDSSRTFHVPTIAIQATTGEILYRFLDKRFSACSGNTPPFPELKR